MQPGQPSSYTEEIAAVICERIAEGESLRAICRGSGMPAQSTIFKWLAERQEFSEQYARAREAQADVLFDEILHIADTPLEGVKTKVVGDKVETMTGDMIEHRRLQVDARKWMLGKMQPKKYGEKVTSVLEGGENPIGVVAVSDRERAKAMAMLAMKAQAAPKG
jgi:hypothetical protein